MKEDTSSSPAAIQQEQENNQDDAVPLSRRAHVIYSPSNKIMII